MPNPAVLTPTKPAPPVADNAIFPMNRSLAPIEPATVRSYEGPVVPIPTKPVPVSRYKYSLDPSYNLVFPVIKPPRVTEFNVLVKPFPNERGDSNDIKALVDEVISPFPLTVNIGT